MPLIRFVVHFVVTQLVALERNKHAKVHAATFIYGLILLVKCTDNGTFKKY